MNIHEVNSLSKHIRVRQVAVRNLQTRVSQDLLDRIDDAAEAFNTTRSELMRAVMEEFLARQHLDSGPT
jgi:metal-responsive CopG/Arc/MetJ family transcriptional regulator